VRNFTTTAVAKIQNFCIKVESTTEFSVSLGQLLAQLGKFPQIAFFGRAKWKFVAVWKANFEAYEMLHLLTNFGEYFSDCAMGYEIIYDCVAVIFE
jgi:hypothetical protein